MPTENEKPVDSSVAPIEGIILDGGEFGESLAFSAVKMPPKRHNIPCHYFYKESLRPGTFNDSNGRPWTITPKDIEDAKSDLDRSLLLGHEPTIQNDHRNPTKSFGFVKGARINDRGGLELLHQFVGDAERDEALRRKTSIMLLPNYEDANKNRYRWFCDHSAVVFRPQLKNLKDFEPALAASGETVNATYLSLSNQDTGPTPEKESVMDYAPLRAALGDKANGKPDAELLPLLLSGYTEATTKVLALSEEITDQKLCNSILGQQLNESESKVLALSEATPVIEESAAVDPQILALSAKLSVKEIELAKVEKKITDKQAEWLKTELKSTPALALSADPSTGSTNVDKFIAFASLGITGSTVKPLPPIQRGEKPTEATPLALSGDNKPLTEAEKAALLALA